MSNNKTYVKQEYVKILDGYNRNEMPLTLPDGRSLVVNKCMICNQYNYKSTAKVNHGDKPFFKWVTMYQCGKPNCMDFYD